MAGPVSLSFLAEAQLSRGPIVLLSIHIVSCLYFRTHFPFVQYLFLKQDQVNDAAGKIYYTNKSAKDGGGTKFSNSNEFIRKSFKKFGVTVSVSSSSLTPTTSNVQYATKYGKLMYISLSNCSPYTDSGYKHAVVGYAFCRLTNDAGSNLSFVKVCDGWSKTPTYVLLASLSKDRYWEVSF